MDAVSNPCAGCFSYASKAHIGSRHCFINLNFLLSEAGDARQLFFIKNYDVLAVYLYDVFFREVGECANGIGGGHVRQVRQIFARKVDAQAPHGGIHAVDLF